jgi:hypothetical protein
MAMGMAMGLRSKTITPMARCHVTADVARRVRSVRPAVQFRQRPEACSQVSPQLLHGLHYMVQQHTTI